MMSYQKLLLQLDFYSQIYFQPLASPYIPPHPLQPHTPHATPHTHPQLTRNISLLLLTQTHPKPTSDTTRQELYTICAREPNLVGNPKNLIEIDLIWINNKNYKALGVYFSKHFLSSLATFLAFSTIKQNLSCNIFMFLFCVCFITSSLYFMLKSLKATLLKV